jgi:uncharacterized membrane protein YgcG
VQLVLKVVCCFFCRASLYFFLWSQARSPRFSHFTCLLCRPCCLCAYMCLCSFRCGRDQAAARELLGWPSGRVTEFYYAIWKLSPEYVLWKSSRKSGNTKGNSTSISSSSSGGGSSASSSSSLALTGNATTGAGRPGFPSLGGSGGGAPPAASTVRFRGPRMRSMAAADYRE